MVLFKINKPGGSVDALTSAKDDINYACYLVPHTHVHNIRNN